MVEHLKAIVVHLYDVYATARINGQVLRFAELAGSVPLGAESRFLQAVRIVLDYAMAEGVRHVEVPVRIDIDPLGSAQSTASITAKAVDVCAAWAELLHPAVAGVGDVDKTIAVHGHSHRRVHFAASIPAPSEYHFESAVARQLLHAVVTLLQHVYRAVPVYREVLGIQEPAGLGPAPTYGNDSPISRELLDTMVVGITYVEVSVGVHCNSGRGIELAYPGAVSADDLGDDERSALRAGLTGRCDRLGLRIVNRSLVSIKFDEVETVR